MPREGGKVGFGVLVTPPRPHGLRPQPSPAAAVGGQIRGAGQHVGPWEVEVWPRVRMYRQM